MKFRQKIAFYFLFFHSTLLISISISVAVTFVVGGGLPDASLSDVNSILPFVNFLLKIWCTAGLISVLLYKETVKKNEYYFYNNVGISKLEIIAMTLFLYILSSILIYLLCLIITKFI